jgi:DNA-binding NtrC family response regulator
MSDSLLIIEDEHLLGTELQRHYQRKGWDVALAETLGEAERKLLSEQRDPLVVLSDMSLPDGNALDLLGRLRKQALARGEWIFLTGYGEVPDSVRALRLGAYDFLTKPCEHERLDLVIAGAARGARAQRRLRHEASLQAQRYTAESFVGRSAAAGKVREILTRLTGVPFSALVISGETGTGKGLAARILHYAGPRAEHPLVEVNCAALPRDLLESELFGHEAGAFTGAKGRYRGLMEQASGGTLFLDEIGELSADLQAKLLSALEDRAIRRLGGARTIPVDLQIIAASNRNLESCVAEGSFRADLYHRLSVVRLALPPLRERKEDLEDLVPLYIAEYNAKAVKQVRNVPAAAWSAMKRHDWPGNVRELRNVIERCVLFSSGPELPAEWLQLTARPLGEEAAVSPKIDGNCLSLPLDGSMRLEDMDRYIIEATLARHDHNVTAAARALGTTRNTLRYRIQKYGLSGD